MSIFGDGNGKTVGDDDEVSLLRRRAEIWGRLRTFDRWGHGGWNGGKGYAVVDVGGNSSSSVENFTTSDVKDADGRSRSRGTTTTIRDTMTREGRGMWRCGGRGGDDGETLRVFWLFPDFERVQQRWAVIVHDVTCRPRSHHRSHSITGSLCVSLLVPPPPSTARIDTIPQDTEGL